MSHLSMDASPSPRACAGPTTPETPSPVCRQPCDLLSPSYSRVHSCRPNPLLSLPQPTRPSSEVSSRATEYRLRLPRHDSGDTMRTLSDTGTDETSDMDASPVDVPRSVDYFISRRHPGHLRSRQHNMRHSVHSIESLHSRQSSQNLEPAQWLSRQARVPTTRRGPRTAPSSSIASEQPSVPSTRILQSPRSPTPHSRYAHSRQALYGLPSGSPSPDTHSWLDTLEVLSTSSSAGHPWVPSQPSLESLDSPHSPLDLPLLPSLLPSLDSASRSSIDSSFDILETPINSSFDLDDRAPSSDSSGNSLDAHPSDDLIESLVHNVGESDIDSKAHCYAVVSPFVAPVGGPLGHNESQEAEREAVESSQIHESAPDAAQESSVISSAGPSTPRANLSASSSRSFSPASPGSPPESPPLAWTIHEARRVTLSPTTAVICPASPRWRVLKATRVSLAPTRAVVMRVSGNRSSPTTSESVTLLGPASEPSSTELALAPAALPIPHGSSQHDSPRTPDPSHHPPSPFCDLPRTPLTPLRQTPLTALPTRHPVFSPIPPARCLTPSRGNSLPIPIVPKMCVTPTSVGPPTPLSARSSTSNRMPLNPRFSMSPPSTPPFSPFVAPPLPPLPALSPLPPLPALPALPASPVTPFSPKPRRHLAKSLSVADFSSFIISPGRSRRRVCSRDTVPAVSSQSSNSTPTTTISETFDRPTSSAAFSLSPSPIGPDFTSGAPAWRRHRRTPTPYSPADMFHHPRVPTEALPEAQEA